MNNQTKRRTEISIQAHCVTIIRTNGKTLSAFCERCQTNVTVFGPEKMATMFRLSFTEVCRRIGTQEIHLTQTGRSTELICSSSFKGNEN